ncbi:pantoate--beta-alanine ligase [bacterium]|nr:pantoate--beta-alanine ligase [bacterium]
MKIINTVDSLRAEIKEKKMAGNIVSLVPTMGFLHDGHLSLMKQAKESSDTLVVSIFVNPMQFGPNEDLDRYPRDLEGDIKKCLESGVDIVFIPDVKEIYPKDFQTVVSVKKVSQGLCGDSRVGHFDGVATVVCKLFMMVLPDIAFFGKKDYQQLLLIKRMVEDLNIPIEIKGCEIVRESDSLAMSSRNRNLSPKGREIAPNLHKIMKYGVQLFKNGETKSSIIVSKLKGELESLGFKIDYLEIRDKNLNIVENISLENIIFAAVFLDNVRLIDNLEII